ncbi:protein sel-1 homolog 2 isoform X3 [Hemicordylus capensis]|uniref:protein sel-1 homolog 2 isoform X3 n=1 Tax=Hemicordylus capensis TaxID=884348 RepID=UPI002303AFA6|nr:protein sel-1 homolog 2 isoform X3 [Hemicordylus capensis]
MEIPLVALVLMSLWLIGHKTEGSLDNQRGKNNSKEETLNTSKILTTEDSLSPEVLVKEQTAKKKDKGHSFYQRSLKILKHSKSKKDKEKAHNLLAKAAELGSQKDMEKLAADMLFGNNGPQNIEAAVSLYEILAEQGSSKGKTGYRYWRGINVPRNCEAALINYRNVATFIAKKLEENEEMPVEKVSLMERPENLSFHADFLDWDVHQYYRYLAERGDTQIQVYLGQLHLAGRKGLEKDHIKAFYYFLKAANAGNANGMAFLGKMYLGGNSAVTQSNVTAFIYFKMAAEKGNAFGLWGLGLLYLSGRGVSLNYTEAFKYFQKAAEKGFADAQFHLGVMYHSGSGVKRNYKLAFRYFYLASQNGQPFAVYYLAQMYATGTGVLRSCQNAVELYRTVCELGRWSEKFLTAYFAFQAGNIDSSLVQYAFLAEMGYEIAQTNSAYIMESEEVKIFHKDQIYPLAFLLWTRAATQGNAFARIKLGDYHYYGVGTRRDYIAAVVHYNLAANQQSAQAMFNLAYMYEHGLGIPKDIHLARRWYHLAAEASPDAFIPVFLACIKLEVMHLLNDLQLLNLTANWKLPTWDRVLKLHWDLFVMTCIIAVLLVQLFNVIQN